MREPHVRFDEEDAVAALELVATVGVDKLTGLPLGGQGAKIEP